MTTSPSEGYVMFQERLRDDPWKMLVACCLLNKTGRKQVEKVIWGLFDRYPTCKDLGHADPLDVAPLIKSLGLQNQRARRLVRMSWEFGAGHSIYDTHGLGTYAHQSWLIFQEGKLIDPDDKELKQYVAKNRHRLTP
jgi:methyl-CpG-binding domain protein 4